ncbi:unnamed protein product, partial [Didymodactylos carnosus]
YFVNLILFAFLPIILPIYFGFKIFKNGRQRTVPRRISVISKRGVDIRQRIEKQVTTMLLLQICVECLTTIPLTVQIIYSNITMDIETEVLRLTKENICATITRVNETR